jgi:hypothetical protein
VSEELAERLQERLLELGRSELLACRYAFLHDAMTVADVAEWHGMSGLFGSCKSLLYPEMHWGSVAEVLTYDVMNYMTRDHTFSRMSRLFDNLAQFGAIARSSIPIPWGWSFRNRSGWLFHQSSLGQVFEIKRQLDHNSEVRFGAFALVAITLESIDQDDWGRLEDAPLSTLLRAMHLPLTARHQSVDQTIVGEELARSGLTPEDQGLVQRWISGEISFFRPAKKADTNRRAQQSVARRNSA